MTRSTSGRTLRRAMKQRLDERTLGYLRQLKYDAIREFDRLRGSPREKRRFLERNGYPLDLRSPRSFNQKMSWRKLYDRNPLLPIVVDKYRVRFLVERLLGAEDANRYLVPLLFVVRKPEDIPFDDLPPEYVIKTNHGSAMNFVVREETDFTREEIRGKMTHWVSMPHGIVTGQWAYRKVPRRIMGEELLSMPDGSPPPEIKLHMFDGKCGLIQTLECETWYDGHTLDSGDIPTLTFFTPDWSRADVFEDSPSSDDDLVDPPANYDEILDIAQRLSSPFDYMRVDLYRMNDEIRFGELTPYPWGGRGHFKNAARDFELGRMWRVLNCGRLPS